MTDRYAVFGNPIEHSRSPQIHQLFAEQTGQDIHYDKQLVKTDQFHETAKAFFDAGGKGLNITVPFKQDACEFADKLTPRAALAAAVNTLIAEADGSIVGDNTDGCGLIRDIRNNMQWPIAGKKVLVLGAGGAVRGILGPLLAEQPAQIDIVNRTASKATELAELIRQSQQDADKQASTRIQGGGYDSLPNEAVDLIINGTSASLSGELPSLHNKLVHHQTCCYDMMYSASNTPFIDWALQCQCSHRSDGLGMLVEQAAESFYLWRKQRPKTQPVIQAIRQQL